jgi:anti-sigma factor RsiW
MSVVCDVAAPFVANSAVEGNDVARPFRRHSAKCLKCQARHAAMSRTARELASMRDERTAAPADLEWRVLSSLEGDLEVVRTWRKPLALAAALVSMAAAVVIWRLRPRMS